jgi:hypothetical protein
MRKLISIVGLAALLLAGFALVAPAAFAATTTCDGELAPGTYGPVVEPEGGACFSSGPITITDGLEVSPGATLQFGSDEDPAHTATISNGVVATNPANLQIHHSTISGGIRSVGGTGPFGPPFDVTWIAIEDNLIRGGVVIDGYDGFWMGFIGNTVKGTVRLSNNNLAEKDDANEYVTNNIRGNLKCWGNDPAPQVGDSEGSPNVVSGRKTGQCANL